MEDNFPTEVGYGFGMSQAHYIQAHHLLCGPVPNRPGPVPVQGPEVGNLCCNQKNVSLDPGLGVYRRQPNDASLLH